MTITTHFAAARLRHGLLALALGLALTAPVPGRSATLDSETGEAFVGSEFGWLMSPEMIGRLVSKGDARALAIIADLYRQNDTRANFTLQNYLERFPRDPAVYDLAGTILLGENKFNEAVLSFRRTLSLDKSRPVWTRAKLGAALLLSGQTDAGEKELQAVLRDDPDNPLALRYASWLAIQRGDLPVAIATGERALNAFGLPEGRFNQAHLDLAELYARADQNWKVVTLLQPVVNARSPGPDMLEVYQRYLDAAMAIGLAPEVAAAMDKLHAATPADNPLRRLVEARAALLMDRDAPKALALYQQLAADVPDLAAQMQPDMARAYGMAGDLDQAMQIFRRLADARPAGQDMQVVTEMVAMLLAQHRADLATADITARLAKAPDRHDLQYLLAEVYVDAGDLPRARAVAEGLATTQPDSAEAQYLLGAILYQQGQGDQAVGHLRRSVELNPARPNVWLTLVGAMHGHEGYAHEGGAGHDQVEQTLAQGVAANPADAMLRTELGLLRLTEGRVPQAITDFDAALAAVPNYVPALNLGALARADLQQDMDRAAQLNQIALKIAPHGAVEQDIAGWIAVRGGDAAAGVPLLRQALALDPGDATVQYHLGIALADTGDRAGATDALIAGLRGDLYRHNASLARDTLTRLDPGPVLTVPVHAINTFGVGAELGRIAIGETPDGLSFTADLTGLPPGLNGVHIHEKPDCGPGMVDGAMAAGAAAGGHYGHDGGHSHAPAQATPVAVAAEGHAHGAGHGAGHGMDHAAAGHGADHSPPAPRGDLAGFTADAAGASTTRLDSDRLSLSELRGRSLMIHAGPDQDGTSGPKIACAIIP